MNLPHLPLEMRPTPDLIDRELEPLLAEPFASGWAAGAGSSDETAERRTLRARVRDRVAASRAASSVMCTARSARLRALELAPGVSAKTLYASASEGPTRPGEPLRARLIDLAPGSAWSGAAPDLHREWLVLRGAVSLGGQILAPRDYHVAPSGVASVDLRTDVGALVFLRESILPMTDGDAAFTVHDHECDWPEYAPGIRRRVLWQRAGQAALLYHAQPGAAVPLHTHGHDEECLMVEGELFLDDVLLQSGDYQLAPAGTSHRITETDTGVVIYAHGDLDLQWVPEPAAGP